MGQLGKKGGGNVMPLIVPLIFCFYANQTFLGLDGLVNNSPSRSVCHGRASSWRQLLPADGYRHAQGPGPGPALGLLPTQPPYPRSCPRVPVPISQEGKLRPQHVFTLWTLSTAPHAAGVAWGAGASRSGHGTPADGADLHMDLPACCALAERGVFLSGMFPSQPQGL